MTDLAIRDVEAADHAALRALLVEAFEQPGEADLVEALRKDGDVVLERVAISGDRIAGHVLFSRLTVEAGGASWPAVALAPLSVGAGFRRQGIAAALVEDAHGRLRAGGETLSVVLGEPAYYGRFGYTHARAAGFASDYQCDALQALSWTNDAPVRGRLVYAKAFGGL